MKRYTALSARWKRKNRHLAALLSVGLLFVSFGIIGCGGHLGRIEPSAVDTAIADAETSINAAAAVDAPTLAAELFESASTQLAAARTALEAKNGSEALSLAYQARVAAAQAKAAAVTITKNSELNASILQRTAEAESLQESLNSKTTELKSLNADIKAVRDAEEAAKRTVRKLQQENRELGDTRKAYGERIAQLSDTLADVQERTQHLQTEVKNARKTHADLRRKIDQYQQKYHATEKHANEEAQQKRAMIAEIDSLRRELADQAQVYTEKLATAKQQNAAAKQDEYLKQKASEARAYVDSQPPIQPVRTGRISLTDAQVTAGKTALRNWELAWNAKDFDRHIRYYEPTIIADKVVIRESKEDRNKIDRGQLAAEIRQMGAETWHTAKAETEVEGDNVIGIQRYTRLAVPAADENATELYTIWIREVWFHPVGNDWRIHHEIWQVYENVPNF